MTLAPKVLRAVTTLLLVASVTTAFGEATEPERLPLESTVSDGQRQLVFETDEVTWLSLDVAPDGSTIVFDALGDLYTVPFDGGRAERLTSGMGMDAQPTYSPDGSHIAFVSDRSGSQELWLIDADGGNPRALSNGGDKTEFASPAFAPDGSHVVASKTDWGLRTFELWGYHLGGGSGVQITKAKPSKTTPVGQRRNALGAVYSNDGRYLYYARKFGGFAYNLYFPQWQVVRHDLRYGNVDYLTQAHGSAFRPKLSPSGDQLVYGTRSDGQTGLRIRNLETGADRWLVYPIQRDDQESRFTRDLLPGYAFTPDGSAVVFSHKGHIERVDVTTGRRSTIPMHLEIRQELGPSLDFPYRLGLAPVKASIVQDAALSPDGGRVAFSTLTRVYVHDFATSETRPVSPDGATAYQPTWSPDGRHLAFVSWSNGGGHIWRRRANGRGNAERLTRHAAFYRDPVWSPDGKRIVAVRASSFDRLDRETDIGEPAGSELVWLPASGGAVTVALPSRNLSSPHFGPDPDRIYLYKSPGLFPASGQAWLTSLRFDGTDRRNHLAVKGPGIYYSEDMVPVVDIRLAPDGRHALVHHANQLYVLATLNGELRNVEVKLDKPALPTARLTDVGADDFGWSADSQTVLWTVGDTVYRRALGSIDFDADLTPPEDDAALREAAGAVAVDVMDVYLPRHEPQGTIALVGATALTMEADAAPIEDAVVLIENGRIAAIGPRATTAVPEGVETLDLGGRFLVPGYVDTHAHYRPLRNVLDLDNASFLANLAYGVTTGLDVQPSTVDVLAYRDLIDAGLMIGPRVLSTGPAIFSNNNLTSLAHTRSVLSRYKRHYGVRNLKAYIAGNRKQRQWIVQAAHELQLMPTTEGSLDMKLAITHMLDGFSGHEHNFPIVNAHRDVTELAARSGIRYTPTLLVSAGGPHAEGYFYVTEAALDDTKLNRFTPRNVLAARALRRGWFHASEHVFAEFAADAGKIVRAGGRVGVGAHGQLQGLGYHWEMWALARGMTPLEVLTAATRGGAEIIGIGADIGTLSSGKLADIVVLRANPLQDIRHTAAIEQVIKNGEIYDADTLDRRWPSQQPLAEQWWWRDRVREHVRETDR